MLEGKLREVSAELSSAFDQVASLKKDGGQPSPGLLAVLAALRIKQENLMQSVEIWRGFGRQYPGYDPKYR
jgi:hypothetical protein